MEHSRLLKFFKQQRSIPDMAEVPTFKVQVDYQKPENVEAEVPESQEIRAVDTDTVTEVTDGDFTLSPVITVTKKESTFTKGDLKLQKVTVTEDIAIEEIQNGGPSKITRTLKRDGKTITRTTSTTESNHRRPAVEVNQHEERKSKIPMLKFKQTVERVKKETKLRQKPDEEVAKRPRKSSIPKLSKETKKALKKHEAAPKTKELAPEDEFEKIYEEIADKQTDADGKILSVKVEDTEKVESKFEELMHSYEEDDISVVQVERLRQSKIPALRRRKADGNANKLNSIVNNIRIQNAVRNSREFPIEDEFGKVTTKTISTKRFGRVNSREAAMTVDTYNVSNDSNEDVIKIHRITKQSARIVKPVVSTKTRTEKVINLDANDNEFGELSTIVDAYDASNNKNEDVITTERIIKQSSRISTPVVSKVTRTEKVTNLDANDNEIREFTMIVDASNENNQDVITTQRIIKQSTRISTPVVSKVTRTEKVTKINTNDDDNTDIHEAITTRKTVTKQTSVPGITEVTDTETVVVDNTESNVTDIHDTAKNIARERIIREISKVKTPVTTEVTVTNVINTMNPDDRKQYTIKKEFKTTESIVENSNVGIIENSRDFDDNPNRDTTPQAKDIVETNVTSDDINTDITNNDVTKAQRVTKITKIGIPVLTKEKSMKVITTQTSINSDIKKEVVNTVIGTDNLAIGTTKEVITRNVTTDTSINQNTTPKGVMVTEQIVKEGIKIGIPVFTKVTDETSDAVGVNVDDIKDVKTDREKDSIEIKNVIRTHSQENVKSVGIHKLHNRKSVDEHTNSVTEVYDVKYNKFDDESVKNSGSDSKMDIIKTDITKTIINLESNSKLTEAISTEPSIDITDKKLTIITNTNETKPNIIDFNSQTEIKDSDTLLQDKIDDMVEITVLKGNVSRLINKLGSQGNYETNKKANIGAEIDIVNQERIRRLDKMITDFNKVDLSHVNAKEYIKESLSKKEDSVDYPPNKEGEQVTILKGNVNRLINKLGAKETETMSNKGVIINEANKNDENIENINDKSNQNVTEHSVYDIKNINTDTVLTVIKKGTIDSSISAQDKYNINVIETKKGNLTEEDTNIGNKKEIVDSSTAELENDENTEFAFVDIITKETVDSGFVAPEKDNNNEDIIRGSVGRLINRISTKEIDKSEKVINDLEKEIPRKKSVLSKIAIFERLEPQESYPKARSENKLSKLVVKDISASEKPRIVDEVLKDRAKFNSNDINDTDLIAITSINETTVSTEPIIVNEVWKASVNKDRNVQNIVTERQKTMSFATHNNKVDITTISTDDITYTEDANLKPIDGEPSTENVRSNVYFMSDKDNVQNETTEVLAKNSKQIYDRVKHKYDIYEQNAVAISQELNRSESRDYTLKIDGHTIKNGATTAEVTNEFKFDLPILKSEELQQINDFNEFKTTDVRDDFKFNQPIRFTSKEDYKRAKSLAESDVGDAVRGQVNRMVGRMKSVDFLRGGDVIKTEKISIKEMPRKSSVLEKIALFEGKSATARLETSTERVPSVTKKAIHLVTEVIHQQRTTKQCKPTTPKVEITSEIPSEMSKNVVITEEKYQEKISELEAAKSLYQPVVVSTLTLGNGVKMPVIALGTALLEPRLIPYIIGTAIDLGYRAIDTAYIYGNEKVVGEAIKAKIDDGTVKREELFIMSKLWSTFHRGDLVETACKATLEKLGLTYIDLFMIHNPMSFKEGGDPIPRIATVLQYSQHDYLDAWFAMEKLLGQGLVKSIGVSNFNSTQLQRILDKGRVKPVVNQVECHPYLSQERLEDFFTPHNITLSCYGVLGSKGTPAEYKSPGAPAIDDPLVQVMAQGLNVTTAQLLIRYELQRGHNVVVKSSSGAHLKDNLDALNFTLSEPQMKALHALNKNKRMFTFIGMGETHKHYPFTAPY